MEIVFTSRASKQLKKIYAGNNKVYINIKNAIISLTETDSINNHDIKALKGKLKPYKRLRIQNYRVIFNIDNNTCYIVSIEHRQGAYND